MFADLLPMLIWSRWSWSCRRWFCIYWGRRLVYWARRWWWRDLLLFLQVCNFRQRTWRRSSRWSRCWWRRWEFGHFSYTWILRFPCGMWWCCNWWRRRWEFGHFRYLSPSRGWRQTSGSACWACPAIIVSKHCDSSLGKPAFANGIASVLVFWTVFILLGYTWILRLPCGTWWCCNWRRRWSCNWRRCCNWRRRWCCNWWRMRGRKFDCSIPDWPHNHFPPR
jgi:hypothetical protein